MRLNHWSEWKNTWRMLCCNPLEWSCTTCVGFSGATETLTHCATELHMGHHLSQTLFGYIQTPLENTLANRNNVHELPPVMRTYYCLKPRSFQLNVLYWVGNVTCILPISLSKLKLLFTLTYSKFHSPVQQYVALYIESSAATTTTGWDKSPQNLVRKASVSGFILANTDSLEYDWFGVEHLYVLNN